MCSRASILVLESREPRGGSSVLAHVAYRWEAQNMCIIGVDRWICGNEDLSRQQGGLWFAGYSVR